MPDIGVLYSSVDDSLIFVAEHAMTCTIGGGGSMGLIL